MFEDIKNIFCIKNNKENVECIINNNVVTGRNITIKKNGTVYLEDKEILKVDERKIEVIVNGNVESLDTVAKVEVKGNAGEINTVGSVTVGEDVLGSINTTGSVSVEGNVSGSISTVGKVTVGGNKR